MNFKIYNTGPTGINPVLMGNVARVDTVNGVDNTAYIGGNPFKTIEAAILAINNAISSPTNFYTIWILPGIYTLTDGITIPQYCCIRGLNTQTVIINLTATTNKTMITMGENTRLEDVTCNLLSNSVCNLTGILFPGTTSVTSKVRTMVMTVNNSGLLFSDNTNVYGVNCAGTGTLSSRSFSFNCIKGSTINVLSNGAGVKRGIIVTGSNIATLRDTNIYVAQPTNTTSIGTYVGIETNDLTGPNLGSIQLRSTTVGTVTPIVGQSYLASDILQTTPANVTNPSYLASPGIQLGPGSDLVTKTAGGLAFSTYVYPTTIFYGCLGNFNNLSKSGGYLWPGTVILGSNYPDTTPNAIPFYRIQQPSILCGMTLSLITSPGQNKSLKVQVKKTPVGGSLTILSNYSHTFNNSTTTQTFNYYNTSVNFNTGDYIHIQITYDDTIAKDLSIQLDMF